MHWPVEAHESPLRDNPGGVCRATYTSTSGFDTVFPTANDTSMGCPVVPKVFSAWKLTLGCSGSGVGVGVIVGVTVGVYVGVAVLVGVGVGVSVGVGVGVYVAVAVGVGVGE